MPVISFNYEDMMSLLGLPIPRDELIERLPMMGADIEASEDENWEVEFFPSRPDLYSVEGIARALRNFLCDPDEIKEFSYPVADSGIVVTVDPSVKAVRPFIACARVDNVRFNDEFIKSLMNIQEKLHLTLGRKRVKVAIGVHDVTPVKPPITYKAADPKDVVFVPLESTQTMNLTQILRNHKKGREYGFTLEGFEKYPILMDSLYQVLSFPPIINGELTKVKEDTRNLFLDVTGTSEDAVNLALNIIACLLADRGGKLYSCTVKYQDHTAVTPDLSPKMMDIDIAEANGLLGTQLAEAEVITALRRMGHRPEPKGGGRLAVWTPPYRGDILHPWDLFEDIAIGYGFHRIKPDMPKSATFGRRRPEFQYVQGLRGVFLGLGLTEVNTLTLSNEQDQFTNMGIKEIPPEHVSILNPISKDHTCLRAHLMPSLFNILKANKHRELPQQIFEIGDVVPSGRNELRASALIIDAKSSFTQIKSLAESLLHEMYLVYDILPKDVPPYIPGRSAVVVAGGQEIGDFGEVHPATISAFELGNPVTGLNLDITKVLGLQKDAK